MSDRDHPTDIRELASDLVVHAARLVRAVRRDHELPARTSGCISLLDEHGPLGHHRSSADARPLLAADHVRRGRRAGRARAGSTRQPNPADARGTRGHADRRPAGDELDRVRRRHGERGRRARSPPTPTTPPRTSPRPSPCSADRPRHRPPERHLCEPSAPTRTRRRADPGSFLEQPRAVWAVAFACVIAFMGIGLVDPILKAIADQLDATPSQVLAARSPATWRSWASRCSSPASSRAGSAPSGRCSTGLVADHRLRRAGRLLRHRRRRSSASAPAGGSATRSSSRPRCPRSSRASQRLDRRRRSSSSRPRSASASPPARCIGGVARLESRGARPFFGVSVLMTIALVADRVPAADDPAAGTSYVAGRPVPRRCATPALLPIALTAICLQPGLLHAARRHGRSRCRHERSRRSAWIFFGWGVLLAHHLGVVVAPRAAAARSAPLPTRARRLAGRSSGSTSRRDGGLRPSDEAVARASASIVAGAFLGVINTVDHRGRHGRRPGRAAGRVGGVLVRPLLRRRRRAVRRAASSARTSACTRRSGWAPSAVAVGRRSCWPPASRFLRGEDSRPPRTARPRPTCSRSATRLRRETADAGHRGMSASSCSHAATSSRRSREVAGIPCVSAPDSASTPPTLRGCRGRPARARSPRRAP